MKKNNPIQDWVDQMMNRGTPNGTKSALLTKQRCVNIGGRDLLCVQDTASVQPHPFLLFGGLALLLWIAR